MAKTQINTDNAPAAVGAYSQGIISNGFVFTAGQIALDPATKQLVSDDIDAQTHQVMKNLQAVVEAGGSSMAQLVKVTIFLADINDFQTVNSIYATYLPDDAPKPARSAFQVGQLPLGARVEIEAIAALES